MASGSQNLTSDKARILSTTPGSAYFWRGDNTWSNILTDSLYLTSTTDLSGTADNRPALIIGNIEGQHLELDGNEIHSKASETTTSTLYLNYEGGLTHCGDMLQATALGITNTDSTTGLGLSLYNGAINGAPTYGIMFAGTGTFGTHGSVSSNWATYFTMSDHTTRGWIFRRGTTNVASISGGGTVTLSKNAQICFYGNNDNASPKAQMGYQASVSGVMHCKNTYQTSGAFYIWSNGCDGGNDNGGIAIDNEGVTVFGAGDAGDNFTGVFRVINEDSVGTGPVFTVKKAGACYFGNGQGYYISNDGSTYTGKAANVTGIVAIANGGTGASSAAGARYNLSVPAMSLSTSYPKLMAINSSGSAVDNWIMIGSSSTYGILPGASGGAGSGHCYIGTSSWYWAYAYIDNIYGSLTGNATSASKVGTSATWLYFNNSNEVNFGGTNTSATIYFGYRATDSRPRPTAYIFGVSGAYASITCGAISASSSITAAGTITASAGLLKSTYSSNTVTIGSQNSGWCHIYNSANIPFIFNNTVCTTSGNLGHSSYPFANLILASGGRASANGGNLYLGNANNSGWVLVQDICSHSGAGDTYWSARVGGVGHFKQLYGAVWNDYAEMRNVPEAQVNINRICDDKGEVERNYPNAGCCVTEVGDGSMILTTKRLQKGCKIISDTFGFCIGETEDSKTPIAVTGRVLAYPYESIEELKEHIGDCVCSGPNGTISIMTNEEKIKYPECIVGIISEIPTYEIWKCGNKITKPISVNNRIWIYVR